MSKRKHTQTTSAAFEELYQQFLERGWDLALDLDDPAIVAYRDEIEAEFGQQLDDQTFIEHMSDELVGRQMADGLI